MYEKNADVISGFTLLRTVIVCGGILCEGRGKVPSDYDAYLQETGMPENEIQKLDEHVKQFIVDDLKNGDGNLSI